MSWILERARIDDESLKMHSLEKLNKMSENSHRRSHRIWGPARGGARAGRREGQLPLVTLMHIPRT